VTTDARRRPDRRIRALQGSTRVIVIATIAVFAVVPLLAAFGAWRDGWEPAGDVAIIGVRSLDAWTSDAPLVGQPTTGDSYAHVSSFHPGPVEYWLVGPFVHAAGPALGMPLAVALLNGVTLAGIMWVAFRRGGPALLAIMALLVAALIRGIGAASLYDPFNSELATYPLLLTVLAAWSVLMGDRKMLPVLAAAATVTAQTHVVGATIVAPLLIFTVVGLVLQAREGRWIPRRDRTSLIGAGAILGLAWLPVLVREVSGPSNVSALMKTATAPHPRIGLAFGLDRLFSSIVPPIFVRSSGGAEAISAFVGRSGAFAVLLAAVVLGGTVGLVLLARRKGRRGPAVLGGLVLVTALTSLYATSTAPPFSAIRADVTRATWVVSLLVWLTAIWSGWSLLAGGTRRKATEVVAPVASALSALVLVAALLGSHVADQRDGRFMPTIDQLSTRTIAAIPAGTYHLDLQGELPVFTLGPGLALRLETSGRPVTIPPGPFGVAYGPGRTSTDRATAGTLRVATGDAPDPKAGERLVAQAPLTDAVDQHVYVYLSS